MSRTCSQVSWGGRGLSDPELTCCSLTPSQYFLVETEEDFSLWAAKQGTDGENLHRVLVPADLLRGTGSRFWFFMWAEARCSAAWRWRSGRSCWRASSCSLRPWAAAGRRGAAERGGGATGGEPGGRSAAAARVSADAHRTLWAGPQKPGPVWLKWFFLKTHESVTMVTFCSAGLEPAFWFVVKLCRNTKQTENFYYMVLC